MYKIYLKFATVFNNSMYGGHGACFIGNGIYIPQDGVVANIQAVFLSKKTEKKAKA